jgi:hypothetical protein
MCGDYRRAASVDPWLISFATDVCPRPDAAQITLHHHARTDERNLGFEVGQFGASGLRIRIGLGEVMDWFE